LSIDGNNKTTTANIGSTSILGGPTASSGVAALNQSASASGGNSALLSQPNIIINKIHINKNINNKVNNGTVAQTKAQQATYVEVIEVPEDSGFDDRDIKEDDEREASKEKDHLRSDAQQELVVSCSEDSWVQDKNDPSATTTPTSVSKKRKLEIFNPVYPPNKRVATAARVTSSQAAKISSLPASDQHPLVRESSANQYSSSRPIRSRRAPKRFSEREFISSHLVSQSVSNTSSSMSLSNNVASTTNTTTATTSTTGASASPTLVVISDDEE